MRVVFLTAAALAANAARAQQAEPVSYKVEVLHAFAQHTGDVGKTKSRVLGLSPVNSFRISKDHCPGSHSSRFSTPICIPLPFVYVLRSTPVYGSGKTVAISPSAGASHFNAPAEGNPLVETLPVLTVATDTADRCLELNREGGNGKSRGAVPSVFLGATLLNPGPRCLSVPVRRLVEEADSLNGATIIRYEHQGRNDLIGQAWSEGIELRFTRL